MEKFCTFFPCIAILYEIKWKIPYDFSTYIIQGHENSLCFPHVSLYDKRTKKIKQNNRWKNLCSIFHLLRYYVV